MKRLISPVTDSCDIEEDMDEDMEKDALKLIRCPMWMMKFDQQTCRTLTMGRRYHFCEGIGDPAPRRRFYAMMMR